MNKDIEMEIVFFNRFSRSTFASLRRNRKKKKRKRRATFLSPVTNVPTLEHINYVILEVVPFLLFPLLLSFETFLYL